MHLKTEEKPETRLNVCFNFLPVIFIHKIGSEGNITHQVEVSNVPQNMITINQPGEDHQCFPIQEIKFYLILKTSHWLEKEIIKYGGKRFLPVASSEKLAHPLHWSLYHEPAAKRSTTERENGRKLWNSWCCMCLFIGFKNNWHILYFQYLHCHTFRTGGFVIKSSKGSSGLTVVKFSCKIPIFFSLSHPDGLKYKTKVDYRKCKLNILF